MIKYEINNEEGHDEDKKIRQTKTKILFFLFRVSGLQDMIEKNRNLY